LLIGESSYAHNHLIIEEVIEEFAADTTAVFHMITPLVSDLGGNLMAAQHKAQMINLRFVFPLLVVG
jgi:hypothetical protein